MDEYVTDTNILTKLANKHDPQSVFMLQVIKKMEARGDTLFLLPQNLYEFYTVATRPTTARGGLGMRPSRALDEIVRLRGIFGCQQDTDLILPEWLKLIKDHNVSGLAAHDARIVAAMNVHSITHILTFNSADFLRYTHLTVVNPHAL